MAIDMNPPYPVISIPADCHPKIAALRYHWLSIRPGEALPGRQHFDPMRIPDILPNVTLVEVGEPGSRFLVRLDGTRIVRAFGQDNRGKSYERDIVGFAGSSLELCLTRCVRTGCASWYRGRPEVEAGQPFLLIERAAFPFATDGTRVDQLLILTVFLCEKGMSRPMLK